MKKSRFIAAMLAATLAVSGVPCGAAAEVTPKTMPQNMPAPVGEVQVSPGNFCGGGGNVELTPIMLTDEEAAQMQEIIEGYKQNDDGDVDFAYNSSISDYLSYDYTNNYIYKQMSSSEKAIYDKFYSIAYKSAVSTVDYSIMGSVNNIEYALVDSLNYSEYNLSVKQLEDVFYAFYLTNPQFFHLFQGLAYSNGNAYVYTWGEFSSADSRNNALTVIANKTNSMLQEINSQPALMEKEEAIYRIICENLVYDHDAFERIEAGDYSDNPYSQTIAGMFLNNTTVCAGYAAVFTYLCNLTGIQSVQEMRRGMHQWNAVELYGNWYVIDTCWMDQDENGFNYNFFNQSMAYIHSLDEETKTYHTDDTYSSFSNPECTKNSYKIYLEIADSDEDGDYEDENGYIKTNMDNYTGEWYWYCDNKWTVGDLYVEGAEVSASAYGEAGYAPIGWKILEWDPSAEQWNYAYTVWGRDLNFKVTNKHISAVAYFKPVDTEGIQNFVERLYTTMLGRASEPAGKKDWVSKLSSGETAANVASGFVLSPELANQNLSNLEFVSRMYRTFLNREPDQAGHADWVNALDSGCSYAYILNSFAGSEEFFNLCLSYGITAGTYQVTEPRDMNRNLTAFTSRMYTKALGRSYDVAGLNDWTNRYLTGEAEISDIAYGFIFSPEFVNKNLSNSDYVDTLYRTFFNREPDDGGKSDWMSKLAGGMSREEVLDGFVGSQECKNLVASFGIA